MSQIVAVLHSNKMDSWYWLVEILNRQDRIKETNYQKGSVFTNDGFEYRLIDRKEQLRGLNLHDVIRSPSYVDLMSIARSGIRNA